MLSYNQQYVNGKLAIKKVWNQNPIGGWLIQLRGVC